MQRVKKRTDYWNQACLLGVDEKAESPSEGNLQDCCDPSG